MCSSWGGEAGRFFNRLSKKQHNTVSENLGIHILLACWQIGSEVCL